MSLGLGIFLSTVLVSSIYLYRASTNKMNWHKIIKIILWILIGVPAICLIYYLINMKYQKYPKVAYGYWDLKVGDHAEDVLFYKGYPTYAFTTKFDRYSIDKQKYKLNSTRKQDIVVDFKPHWLYLDNDVEYTIKFDKDKTLRRVTCGCMYGKSCYSWICPTVSTISINSSFEDIVEVFGIPATDSYEKRYGLRFLKYPKYNLGFRLSKNKVYQIIYYSSHIE